MSAERCLTPLQLDREFLCQIACHGASLECRARLARLRRWHPESAGPGWPGFGGGTRRVQRTAACKKVLKQFRLPMAGHLLHMLPLDKPWLQMPMNRQHS